MAELPSDTIFDILSRLPVKTLARFRCVSKPWCAYIDDDYLSILHGERAVEELTPIMYDPNISCITRFDIIKSEEGNTILEAKKVMYASCSSGSFDGGSCNGLLYFPQKCIPLTTSLAVIHPLRKEFHALPPMQRRLEGLFYLSELSRGLGFDVSTSTFKMVCVLSIVDCSKISNFGSISKNLCTMVHVLGKDSSWREIPQVPPCFTSGEGIFADRFLYWQSASREVIICFDVRNEEFTLICPPKRRCGHSVTYHQLVDLQGEVGHAYSYSDDIIEVWVLKQKQWVKHCQFSKKPPLPRHQIDIIGRWNKYGDLLIKPSGERNNLFVYSLRSKVLDKVNIVEYGYDAYMYMYPASSMFSIRGINKTNQSVKTDVNAG